MKSNEIRELMAQIESTEIPLNLRPSDTDREVIRAQRQLTLAVLEVALQLDTLPNSQSSLSSSFPDHYSFNHTPRQELRITVGFIPTGPISNNVNTIIVRVMNVAKGRSERFSLQSVELLSPEPAG